MARIKSGRPKKRRGPRLDSALKIGMSNLYHSDPRLQKINLTPLQAEQLRRIKAAKKGRNKL